MPLVPPSKPEKCLLNERMGFPRLSDRSLAVTQAEVTQSPGSASSAPSQPRLTAQEALCPQGNIAQGPGAQEEGCSATTKGSGLAEACSHLHGARTQVPREGSHCQAATSAEKTPGVTGTPEGGQARGPSSSPPKRGSWRGTAGSELFHRATQDSESRATRRPPGVGEPLTPSCPWTGATFSKALC